jgi:integrase
MTTKLKYLYRKPKPSGGEWVYFRNKDGSLEALPDEGSQKFRAAYHACLMERDHKPNKRTPRNIDVGAVTFPPGAVGWFIRKYLACEKFTQSPPVGFADGTKYNYRKYLEHMSSLIGGGLLGDLTEEHVDVYLAGIAEQLGGATADRHRHLLSNLWKFARRHPNEFKRKGRGNPTLGAETFYVVREQTKAWPDDVQDKFVATAPAPLIDAFYVLKFTAQRGGDATKMKWSDLDDGFLRIVQEKTGTPHWHKLPAPLVERLAEMQKRRPAGCDHILVSSWGSPWANATTLSHAIRRHMVKIGMVREVRGEVKAIFKMHGLRATAAKEVASLPTAPPGAVRSVTGHLTDKLANQYAREFDQKRINEAAIDAWDADTQARRRAKADKRRGKMRVVR